MKSNIYYNILLSRITLITNLGDFIAFFAVLILIYNSTQSVLLASYTVPIKSIAVVFAGLTFPKVASYLSFRSILFYSQIISGILILLLAFISKINTSPYFTLAVLFFQTIFNHYFFSSRESYSKSLATHETQRTFQAQIFHSFYSAQFIGPIISFILLKTLPINIPLYVDVATFFVAAALCLQIPKDHLKRYEYSILKPLKYIWQFPALLQIFLLRSIGYWIPIGIYNYLTFSVVQEHYGLSLIYSAWIYSATGFGSALASATLKSSTGGFLIKFKNVIKNTSDAKIALIATVTLGFTRIAFISLPTFYIAILVIVVAGMANGFNAIATLSLRRKLTTDNQFPEIIGLEAIISKITDWAVATLCFLLISKGIITFSIGIWCAAISLWILSLFFLSSKLRGV